MNKFVTWAKDAVERAAKTFVEVFLAVFLASASGLDMVDAAQDVSSLEKAALAGVGAVLSLALSGLSRWSGSSGNASLVNQPANTDRFGIREDDL